MWLRKSPIIGLAFLALLTLWGSAGQAALAQPELTMTPSLTPAGLAITAVQPNNVPNTAATELVVTGTGFANGAVIVLAGSGALSTTYVSANLLRADLPAGIAPGVYTVTVVNPDAASASLANGLTITAPAGPTHTPEPTHTPLPTAFVRPVLVVSSYGASSAEIVPGSNLDFEMTLANAGQSPATNIMATFTSGDFVPRETGGVRALGGLSPGESIRFWQPLFAARELAGKTMASLEVKVSYTDANGTAYNETFALTFPVFRPSAGPGATATPTPTPTATATAAPRLRPQLIVTSYGIDLAQLQPGNNFALNLTVQNQGNALARRVTLILGGGSAADGSLDGTPQPGGGLAGAGGEFSKFAPVGASNVQSLGDLAVGQSLTANIRLIVNATTEPGAYPVKVSLVYTDEAGGNFVDDQVITLLVYKRPSVEMTFYMPPPPFFANEPGSLPLQLVNTGSKTAVLGYFRVQAEGAMLENNSVFVGALEPGGFFPMDAFITPQQPGPLALTLSISYTDDFSQPQTLTQTVDIEVMESFIIDEPFEPFPGEGPLFPEETQPETWGQRIWRFILGLLGLSSGRS